MLWSWHNYCLNGTNLATAFGVHSLTDGCPTRSNKNLDDQPRLCSRHLNRPLWVPAEGHNNHAFLVSANAVGDSVTDKPQTVSASIALTNCRKLPCLRFSAADENVRLSSHVSKVHIYVCVCVYILSVSICLSASTSTSRFASVDRYTAGCTVWYPGLYTHTRHSLLHCTVSQSNLEITIIYQSCPGSLHVMYGGCWPRCLPISGHRCGLDLWNCRCRDFPSRAQSWVLHGHLSGFFLAPWSVAKHVDPTVMNKWCF